MIKTIRIGCRKYHVQEWSDAQMITTDSYGQCDKQRAIIYVCTHLHPIVVADTFLHEIMHAIWHEYNLIDTDHEERIVHTLSTGLVQVMHDNPQLLTWLKKATKDE